MRIVSRILRTTDVRLMGLNYLGSVVRGAFCDREYYCAAPIFRDPGNVGVRGFEEIREKPIRASTLMRVKASYFHFCVKCDKTK